MEPTLNTTPCTPDDLTAFAAEYAEWNAAVEASTPVEVPALNEDGEPVQDADDLQEWRDPAEYEDSYTDVEADADTLASAGMGTDEDYGYFDPDPYYGDY